MFGDRRYTVTKGFDLSVYAYLSGFQARYAHFHMDELGSRFLFQLRGYGNYLPDSRFPKIGKSKAIDNSVWLSDSLQEYFSCQC